MMEMENAGPSEIPENANEHCPGPQSENAGKDDSCQGCPNQEICAAAPKGSDPGSILGFCTMADRNVMCEAEEIAASNIMDVDINKPEAAMGADSPERFSAGPVSSSFSLPGLVEMIRGLVPAEGLILPDSEEVLCRDLVHGQCLKTDCNLEHPTPLWLMNAIGKPSSIGTMSQVPMAPSAAAMDAAQAIMAAQAQAQSQSESESLKASPGASEKDKAEKDKAEILKRTIQVSNIIPVITANQLKELLGVWGTIVDCTIADSNDFAYIEYSKPEQATAALKANYFVLCGRSLNVEMAKSLPPISIAAGMEEQQPSFFMRGTPFDVARFLIDHTGEYSALVRNDNEIVDASDVMNGKVVMLCFFCLPLPSHDIAVAQAVSLISSEMHEFGSFELLLFVDCLTDCDDRDAALSDFVSSFPSFCLTPKYTRRLGATMPLACYPHGLLVNRAQTIEWHKPLDFLLKYGVDAFPFTSEWLSWISQREEAAMSCKSWHSLYNFLCSMPLTFPRYSTLLSKNPGGGPGEVAIDDLQDKCVGLYLCQTRNLIPTLDNVHKNCCKLDREFEIILVYMPFSYFGDPQMFQDSINSTLKERNISWWVFPFINWVSRRLSRLFHQDADDRLIILGPKCEYVELHGEAVIRHHGASAYPFSSQLLVNREVERLRAVTLESLLVYRSLDYVLWMGSGFTHRVPVAALQDKTVFLYLHCAEDHSHNCFDKLYSYCQMKAIDPNFEMVFLGLDTSSTPDIGNSCEMPWLVFPWDPNHSDYVTRTIFRKGDKCSTIIAFGKDGRISSIRALRLVCSSCPDFPLSNSLHNEMSAELAGIRVVHAVPSNLGKYSKESRNHIKALFPLLGNEYFFPGLPVCGRMKTSDMHDFYDCVDVVEGDKYLASKTDYITVIEDDAEYPKAIYERIANIDTSNFDVISFLSAENGQYLVRNDVCKTRFEVEHLRDKKWVMICCLTCPIYFHSRFSLVYRGVSDICSELYDEYGDNFEMVLVFKMRRDFEADESSFLHMLSGFPPLCLVVPFWDSRSRDSICCSLGFSRFPLGLFLRADERKVIWLKTLYDMETYGVDTFPFTDEDCEKKRLEEQHKPWNMLSLQQLFDCSSAENPGGADYYEMLSIKQLEKKLVGVYLCFCGKSIPMLHELHEVCKANNIEFEIVVVCCLFTAKNSNPELLQNRINSALKKRNISWWVLPYKGSVSRKLVRILKSPIEEQLIIVGNGAVDPDGAYFIREFEKLQSKRKGSSSRDGSRPLQRVILEFKSRYRV